MVHMMDSGKQYRREIDYSNYVPNRKTRRMWKRLARQLSKTGLMEAYVRENPVTKLHELCIVRGKDKATEVYPAHKITAENIHMRARKLLRGGIVADSEGYYAAYPMFDGVYDILIVKVEHGDPYTWNVLVPGESFPSHAKNFVFFRKLNNAVLLLGDGDAINPPD